MPFKGPLILAKSDTPGAEPTAGTLIDRDDGAGPVAPPAGDVIQNRADGTVFVKRNDGNWQEVGRAHLRLNSGGTTLKARRLNLIEGAGIAIAAALDAANNELDVTITNTGGGGGGGAVASVFGRTGAVTAASGDYTANLITGTWTAGLIGQTQVQGAIQHLEDNKANQSQSILPLNGVKLNGGTSAANLGTISIVGLVDSLGAIGALTPAADRLAYYTSASAAALATLTAAGRSMIGAADAAAQTALLNTFTASLKGLVPLSGGGTTNFLRADGTWAAPAGGTGTDLTYTASTRLLESSTGTDVTLPLVTTGNAGLAPASGGGTTNFLRADGTWAAPPGGGAVSSVFGRTGAVVAASGDYSASQISFTGSGGLAGATEVNDALNQLDTEKLNAANTVLPQGGVLLNGGTSSVAWSALATIGLDAELAAIAGLTSAADKGIQFTGAGTAGTFDLTAAGRALLDDADAAAQRATLGLVIGTNVQAYDLELAAIAGAGSNTDRLFYYTGVGTGTITSLTAAGRALIDDADAAAQRTTLGATAAGSAMFTAADAAAQTALLSTFTSGLKGLAPASGGGTANFLRADGTWAAPTGGVSDGSVTLAKLADDVLARVNLALIP